MPKKAFHQVSRPENVNSDENLFHSNYDDSNRYNDGISVPNNSHSIITNCTGNESIASLADIESSKTVQKKRGRGRPPKLKTNKQEKELNQLKEEDSSRSSLNSISSYEKEPLCEELENCTVKEYNSNVRDNCQSDDDSWQSANLPDSNNLDL